MNNKNQNYTKRRIKRMQNVEIVYKYELFNESLNLEKIFRSEEHTSELQSQR